MAQENASDLEDTSSIADILEIVERPAVLVPKPMTTLTAINTITTTTTTTTTSQTLQPTSAASGTTIRPIMHRSSTSSTVHQIYQTEADISIFDSLANTQQLIDQPEGPPIINSSGNLKSSTTTELLNKLSLHDDEDNNIPVIDDEEDDVSSIISGEYEIHNQRIQSLHSSGGKSKISSPKNLSVQDFFFNNPYKNNHSNNSQNSFDEQDHPFNYTHNDHSLTSLNSTVSSSNSSLATATVIKPKPIIRKPIASSNLSGKKLINEEPQLSSLRIRGQSQRMKDIQGHGLTLSKEVCTTQDQHIHITPSSLAAVAAAAHHQKDEINLDDDIDDGRGSDFGDDNTKVTPYGGFSRPQMELLENNNIFSNAPWFIVPFEKGNGSLIKAVESARETNQFNDELKWVGTISTPSNIIPDKIKENISNELDENFNSKVLFFDDEEFRGHYHSFCKEILWPIFHYKVPDDPKSNAFENDSWNDYEKVNRKFAEKIALNLKDGDTVWVHDYHLMLVPQYLRELKPNAKIGFFLHISFPSSEVFRCLAQRRKILEGLLGADCISFQTEEYVGHFLQSCNRLLLADFDDKTVYYKGIVTKVSFDPIGINFKNLDTIIKSKSVYDWRKLIRDRWKNKMLIVSRDKFEEIRGIKEKLLSYERFLNDHSEFINLTTMILICLKNSKSNEDYENEIFSIVERINSKANGISNDQPVVILYQDIEFDQYLALLSEANIFIVSTLREGMNLTCHEFICSTHELKSPLILSEFVGSADVLTKGPLLINPYNIKQVSEAIFKSLTMSNEEKLQRWQEAFNTILKHDSQNWMFECLNKLDKSFLVKRDHQACLLKPLTIEDFKLITKDINSNSNKLYILNLDNLTSNLVIEGKVIHSVQQQLINTTLSNLTSNKRNSVYILSYYQRSDLIRRYKRVNDLGFISENGGYIRNPHKNQWLKIIDEIDCEWMEPIRDILKSFCERIPGSYIDVNECSIKFHVKCAKDIDNDHKISLVGDLITHINELYTKDFNIHASLFQGIVIIQELNSISKAMNYIMGNIVSSGSEGNISKIDDENNSNDVYQAIPMSPALSSISNFSTFDDGTNFEFIMSCGGSSQIDEEIYELVNERKSLTTNVLTVRVGKNDAGTCANVSMKGINELLLILKDSV